MWLMAQMKAYDKKMKIWTIIRGKGHLCNKGSREYWNRLGTAVPKVPGLRFDLVKNQI